MNINSPIFYAVVMALAGCGIPIMAAMNAGLGARIQNPVFATTLLVILALFISIVMLFLSPGEIKITVPKNIPLYFYFGGFLFIFYIEKKLLTQINIIY